MADFSGMIAGFNPTPMIRHRRALGTSSFGVYSAGPVTKTTIMGVLVRGLETQELLAEGEKTGEIITYFTSSDLYTTKAPDGFVADLLEDPNTGEVYEVRGVRDFPTHGNFRECAAVKVGQ